MQFVVSKPGLLAAALLGAAIYLPAQTPAAAPSSVPDAVPIPPRASPNDYQARTKAGTVTVAAEFKGHFVPAPAATYTTEDFVAVEVGLFGEPDAKLSLSPDQFSLRINGKKQAVPSQSVVLVLSSLKDPEWIPPEPVGGKGGGGKTSLSGGGGGGGGQGDPPPPPPKMPPELQRVMRQRVQKTALAEGERPLPQAGFLFFPYRGQPKSIQTIELLYKGPAGETTLELHP
jgi:hypothetical protein